MAKLTYEQALAKLYTEAETKLIETIKRKVRYGNATVYERSLLRQIEEQIEILRKSSDKVVQELVKSNYKKGLDQLLKDISTDKTAPRSYNLMSRLNVNQINIIVDNITQQLNQAIATVGRRCNDYIRQITLEATAKKLTQGQTVRQMQKELEAQLEESNTTSISYANGTEHNIKDYASMVARTTTAETQNTAQVVQGNAWGYDLVRMTSHYPTCKVCAMYQGRVYALTKEAANGKYKDKNREPLMFAYLYDTALVDGYNTIHPNCRHRFAILPARAYTLDELAEFSRQSMQPFEDTRSDEERKAYAKEQAIKRKRNESRRQYEKFKSDFPDQAPKTFAVWQRKRNKSRRQYEDVKRSLSDQAPKTFAAWWRMETANSQSYQDLMEDYSTLQKSVDNSGKSGIIKNIELPVEIKKIKSMSPETREQISNAIDKLQSEYEVKLDQLSVMDLGADNKTVPFQYQPYFEDGKLKHRLAINSEYYFNDSQEEFQARIMRNYNRKVLASKSVEDLVAHEFAHIMTFQDIHSNAPLLLRNKELMKKCYTGVSLYADLSGDGSETIAEAFVRLRNNESVPDEARELVIQYIERWKK